MRRKQTCSITTPIPHKKQFKFENDVLYVPLFLYCIKTRKSIHFINNGKKSSNSEQKKDKANPNSNYIVQTSWTFLRFIYRVCRLCQSFQSQQTVTKGK